VVDAAFGWHHEAYIDKKGELFVCAKAKVTSVRVKELRNGERKLTNVKLPPGAGKVNKVTFTRKRMFVCTDKGLVYSFKIIETPRSMEE